MKCSNCGEGIDASAKQCPSCGAKFQSEHDHTISDKIPSSVIGVSVGAVIFLITNWVTRSPAVAIAAGSIFAVVIWFAGSILR